MYNLLQLPFQQVGLVLPMKLFYVMNGQFSLHQRYQQILQVITYFYFKNYYENERLTLFCVFSIFFLGLGCNDLQSFRGYPDIFGWKNVGIATSGKSAAKLVDGQKYYTIVRATTASGKQFYATSNGFTVDSSFVEEKEIKSKSVNNRKLVGEEQQKKNSELQIQAECPINQEWKCQAAQVSVRQYLNEFYGPPRFNARTGFIPPPVVRNGDDDDDGDDDEIQGAGAFGIGAAITVFFLLLAIGIMLISAFGSQSDEFKTNVRRHEHVDEF